MTVSQATEDIISILETVLAKVTDDTDVIWAGYRTPSEMRDMLTQYLMELRLGNLTSLWDINIRFAPTGTFQEHAIQNEWSEEYLRLSSRFDELYEILKAN